MLSAIKAVLLCLAHLLLILSLGPCGGRGSSLREHRLRGSQADPGRETRGRLAPDADMLKALQYIEGLRQRSGAQQRPSFPVDEEEKLRDALRLAEDEGEEDKSEELLQAVLSTLQQTEEAPGRPRGQQRQHAIRPHEKLPLMFEDEEDEEDEEPGEEQESPFKRTNENVEEKYTPQNLATLQSVFDELDKLTSAKSVHKRQDEDEDEEEGEGEEEEGDMFDVRNVAYDSTGGDAAEWGPLAEEEEEEEEKQESSRGLDYMEEEEEPDEDEEEEDAENFPVKRSDDPDDVANMVDYYLLKVLETEEEQKRELEEEEEEELERRAAQTRRGDAVDPRAVYQLIRISQKYQIPPGNLLAMLKTGDGADHNRLRGSGKPGRFSTPLLRRKQKVPEAPTWSRRFGGRAKTPEEQRTEEVLKVLGLGAGDRKEQRFKGSPSRLRSRPAGRPGEPSPSQQRRPAAPKAGNDDGVDEDALAAYLAAQMMTRYPEAGYRKSKTGPRREEGRSLTDSLEQAVQDYFDHMDSDKSRNEKRRSEDEDEDRGGGGGEEQGFDGGEVMKLLSFLNPENDESGAEGKTDDGV